MITIMMMMQLNEASHDHLNTAFRPKLSCLSPINTTPYQMVLRSKDCGKMNMEEEGGLI